MFKHDSIIKSLLVVMVVSVFAFAGSAYAGDGQSITFETVDETEMTNLKELCVSSGGTLDGNTCKCPDDYDWNSERGCVSREGNNNNELQARCAESGGTWEENKCVCPKEHSILKEGICVCDEGYDLVGGESLAEENAKCDLREVEEPTVEPNTLCTGSGGTWANNVCTCPSHASVDVNTGRCVCDNGYHVEGGNSLGDTGARCEPNASGGGTAATGGIKIATVKYNTHQFSDVFSDLEDTVDTIRNVVTQAIDNTAAVNRVATNKQTRPDDNHACPATKQCLLVTDTTGTRNWYEIIDCSVDNFWRNISTNNQGIAPYPTSNSQYSFGYRSSGTNSGLCSESGVGCADNEWVSSWNGYGLIYGVAQRVSIAERPAGTVVTLPNTGVQSGNVCLCKVTGYRPINSGVIAATRTDVSTNSWMVMNYSNAGNSNQDCLNQCGNGYEFYYAGVTPSYFAHIANTCSADAPVAQMCRYYSFFENVADGYTTGHHAGIVDYVGGRQYECQLDDGNGGAGEFASNSHCASVAANYNTWIAEYYPTGVAGDLGYVFGVCGYAPVPSGTNTGDVIDLNPSSIALTYSENDALVCMVRGYKASADATETTVSINKAFVVDADETAGTAGGVRGAIQTLVNSGQAGYSNVRAWYRALANECVQ